jgi:heptosyltransferase-1
MKIAIVKLSALGDIVHAMVVLQYLKNIEVDWIVEERFKEILEHNPHIKKVHCVNLKNNRKNILKEYKKLKSLQKYDLVIDLQGLIKSAVVSKIVGKKVIGFGKNSLREKLAHLFYNKSFEIDYTKNVIERNVELICKALQIKNPDISKKSPFLYSSLKSKIAPVLLVVVGSSWESKIYPKERFVEVINALGVETYLSWGNKKEFEDAKFISSKTEAKILPKMNLNELKSIIANSDLVIGADSGPTHMAWGLNRASITIFGSTPSYRNTYTTKINKTVDCGKIVNARKLNKNDFCITKIEAKEIVKIAKGLLYAR